MNASPRRGLWTAGLLASAAIAAAAVLYDGGTSPAKASETAVAAPAPAPAVPVSVALVERRDIATWDEFSGRLEAVERVDIRSRVAGPVQTVHFREGALVKQGDLLFTIDKAVYAAEVDRAAAQVSAAQSRVTLTAGELERGQKLTASQTITQSTLDNRLNAKREAEANLRAAQAALQAAKLNLSYTDVRAPVAGRVGKVEITTGNLVAAGPGAPILTTLVSVSPIYASFNADEEVVLQALATLPAGQDARTKVDQIPVQMNTALAGGETYQGRLQLIDNAVDARSGTVRVRAIFDNADGNLIPGQFARLRMGQAKAEPALLISERAVGTDQDKKFVMVVGEDNKATYREITLGAPVDGLRIVTRGLKPGEKIVVNGLQRIRPGVTVAPQVVAMTPNQSVAQN
ncbi:efflux RND transporter periplasmic adaptor subunit [Lacibacterium aquatile]|uniref:Efflux RND transporter periplasmic adaptor subunit n=1 Tax=Lacibacterium aquatile TaxID=1168082 RepID=A0ABW5DVM2_9PROT